MREILSGGREEEAVLHPQRLQDVLGDEVHILLARADFDDAAENLDAGAGVAPLRPRLKEQRLFGQLPHHFIERHAHRLRIVGDGRRAGVVLNPRGVGKQVTDGDGVVGNTRADVIGAYCGSDPQALELRQVLFDRVAQSQLAFFGQHHDADCRDRLGHGHDLENRVLLHRVAGFHIGHAGRVELHDVVTVGHQGHGSGDGLAVDKRFHPLRDFRENVLVHTGSFAVGLSYGRRQCHG